MKLSTYLALAGVLVCAPAAAETVFNAKFATTQMEVQRDARGFSHCGVRVVFIDEPSGGSDFYEVTLSILPDQFAGVISVGKRFMSDAMLKQGVPPAKVPVAPPTKMWIAKATDSKPLAPEKTIRKDLLYGVSEAGEVLRMILATAAGSQMQVYTEYPGRKNNRIVAFSAPLEEKDDAALQACLSSLADRMQSTSDAISAKTAK